MLTLLPALALAPLLQAAPATARPEAKPHEAERPEPQQPEAKPAQPAASAPAHFGSRPLRCEVTDVSSQQARRTHWRFRATRVVDLEIGARLVGRARGERLLRLRVYAPGGFLYQVFELPLEASQVGKRSFEARLPVAGTSIMANGLYGRFKVVPYLDEQPRPCGAARGFAIQP